MDQKPGDRTPNYGDVIHDILGPVNGPVSTEELVTQILQRRSSSAKDPRRAALEKIRQEVGRELVFLDETHILPIRLAMQGARFRIRLKKEYIDNTALPLLSLFLYYLPMRIIGKGQMTFLDSQGNPIHVQIVEPPHTITFSEEKVNYGTPVFVFKEWFHSQKFYHKDHILVTFEDWERGVIRLEREYYGEQQADLLAERNRSAADTLFAMLEISKYEDLVLSTALPTLYAKMPDKSGYPPDHYKYIVNNDARMVTVGASIRYADSDNAFPKSLFAETEGEDMAPKAPEFTREEGNQIYRFRAQYKHNPSVWREVAIQGKQTLGDLDEILRDVFQHDSSDHLSGFWQRLARAGGARKRYREVDLATINPFEPGEGSDTPIAALKLQPKDQLKYVYDFGDWIEHTLELVSTGSPEKGVRYPREVARNKPKYAYCVECREKGKETVAKYICVTCSSEKQSEYLLCEECLYNNEEHEDHYTEEITY